MTVLSDIVLGTSAHRKKHDAKIISQPIPDEAAPEYFGGAGNTVRVVK